MNKLDEKYNQIDLFKFIMAIIVVAIHTGPLINCKNELLITIYNNITKLAVPFFFLSSGFFLGKKLDWSHNETENIITVKKYLVKILKMYVFWNIIYLPLAMANYIKSGRTISYSIFDYIRKLLLVGEHYNSYILCYLLATIYALLFIIFMLKLKAKPYVIAILGLGIISISFGIDILVSNGEAYTNFLEILRELIRKTIIDRKDI